MTEKTLFQKIIDREENATFLHEDDEFIIIDNKFPSAPIHYLVIPKKPIPSIADLQEGDAEIVGKLFALTQTFIREQNIKNFKLIFNGGKYLHIPHLHLHILSGENLED